MPGQDPPARGTADFASRWIGKRKPRMRPGKLRKEAGLAIKKEHPILHVAVYDGVESVNKIIELL